MQAQPKSGKSEKVLGLFRRNKSLRSSQPDKQISNESGIADSDKSAQQDPLGEPASKDTQRTKERYVEAVGKLQKAVNKQKRQGGWNPGEFDSLTGEPASYKDLEFRQKLEEVLEIKPSKVGDGTLWERGRGILRYLCHTLAPFAKTFLIISKEGSTVSS